MDISNQSHPNALMMPTDLLANPFIAGIIIDMLSWDELIVKP
jgi:hypothetical protein